ncbi:MAG: (deoxy)nucleoside triphosphate pyrophosphohydrolase [Candidatus Acidiferrales bacterium]
MGATTSRRLKPKHILVVAALIARDGKILICQRRRGDIFGLAWEFPGGKVRADEAPDEALRRELREELGVESTIGREVHRTRHGYSQMSQEIELLFFEARIEAGEPRNLAFEQFAWADPSVLPSYDFLAADRDLVEKLARGEIRLKL